MSSRFWRFATFDRAFILSSSARLLLASVFGLLLVPGYVVAPVLFAEASSSHVAGTLAGVIFHVCNLMILIAMMLVAMMWSLESVNRLSWILLLALGLAVCLNEFAISPVIVGLKVAMAEAGPNAPDKAVFSLWHGLASAIHLASTLLAAVLLVNRSANGRGAACRV